MRRTILFSIILLFSVHLAQGQSKSAAKHESKKNLPKNIILMIGDGMGLSQMYATYTSTKDNLNMTRCPNIALVKTFSEDNYITDSGAAGTAIATGHKTTNGMIGMLTDKTPVKSILKYAENNGLATGLVATSSITHATPAAFIASVESRNMLEEIARQFLDTEIDVFIGGGLNNFSKRTDSLNLIDSLITRNYQVVTTIPEMMIVSDGKLAALLYPEHAPKQSEGRGDMLSLATSKAIDLLRSNEKGFFLMVEGSQIDWGGHDNDLEYVIDETIDFDKACGVAIDFAERNGETLVIVTSDHETGGLTIPDGNLKSGKAEGKFSIGDHSAVPVLLFSTGPGSEKFHGFIDNTDIFNIMFDLFGFTDKISEKSN